MSQLKDKLDSLPSDSKQKIMAAFNEEQSCFVIMPDGTIIAVNMPIVPQATLVEDYGIWSIHKHEG